MSPVAKSKISLPRGWYMRIALGVGVLLASLTWVYQQAEAVPQGEHQAYNELLHELRETDVKLDLELLANRLERVRNYDALTAYASQVQVQAASARVAPGFLDPADRLAVAQAAGDLLDAFKRKAAQVDAFKRDDSVLRNSQAYFPVLAAELLDKGAAARPRGDSLSLAERYVRLVLAYARAPDADALAQVAACARQLAAMARAGANPELIDSLLLHGGVVVERTDLLDLLMRGTDDLNTAARLASLQQRYDDGHDRAVGRGLKYRRMLFLLALLLTAFLAWVFLKLDATRRALEATHHALEGRYVAQQAAEKQLTLHATAFRNAYDGITLTDATGAILDVNPAFSRITGWERSEVLGRNPRVLRSGRHDRDFYQAMWKSVLDTGNWNGEIWNRNKYGEIYPELLSISAIRDDAGQVTNFVAVFSDIRRLKAQETQLAQMAYYDALTGLPNRVLLGDRLQQALAHAKRQSMLLAVCYMDLDGFKPINDQHGHEAGDKVLIEMAQRLKSVLRGGDTVARMGGDEFVLLLQGLSSAAECRQAVARALELVAQPMSIDGASVTLSASVGVAMFPHDDAEPDALMRHADQAMYRAKQSGKNRYHLFDADDDRQVRRLNSRIERLNRALVDGEFTLHYQPKVDMRRGCVVGAEALLRWNHPERGLVLPADFLPLIEDDNLILEVGDWVIRQALTQMLAWQAVGLKLPVSVNVASRQLQAPDFVQRLWAALNSHPGVASQLELEILETSGLEDVVRVSRIIERCHELGVRFALDDFGTGYSSLTYLKRLPADTIKIDQSFVRELLNDSNNLVIVQSVIQLAQSFQRVVIAEGVETEEHGRMLLQLGCDLAQGYGIAKPMPAGQLANWVARWKAPAVWQDIRHLRWDDSIYPILIAEVEHRNWVEQIAYAVQEGLVPSQTHLDDEHACRLGRWYEQALVSGAGYLASSAFAGIAAPHRQVHEVAGRIDRLWRDGHVREARALVPELLQGRTAVLKAMHALEQLLAQPASP